MLRINCYAGETWRTEFTDIDGDVDIRNFNYVGSLGQQDVAKINLVFTNIANEAKVEVLIQGSQTASLSAGQYFGEIFWNNNSEYTLLTKVNLTLQNPVTNLVAEA